MLPLMRSGQFFRPVLPAAIASKIPPRQKRVVAPRAEMKSPHKRVLILQGCAQRAATPNVNTAIEQLLVANNVSVCTLEGEGCCGAVEYHLSAHHQGLQRMRELVDKLYERLGDIDYIVSSASGCGATIKEYPMHLGEDSGYAEKAKLIIKKVIDVSELIDKYEFNCAPIRAAVHTPCTLQHGQGINGTIESILERAGITIVKSREAHLCCGSAGTYSIMQADLSQRLLTRKLGVLQENSPEVIVTANIGCQLHLQSKAGVPVMHWAELLQRQQTGS